MEETTSTLPKPASASTDLRARLYRSKMLLRRYWWILLITVGMGLGLQGYLASKEPPHYISVGRMWVFGKVSLPEGGYYHEEFQNFFGTQIELFKSEILRNRTKARIKLLKPNLKPIDVNLKVVQSPRAAVFLLQLAGDEPQYTQAYLQTLMEEYLNSKKELRAQSSDDAASSLIAQLYKPEMELKQEQEKLLNFKRDNNVVYLEQQGSSAGKYLATLSTRHAELKTEAQLLDLLTDDQNTERAVKSLGSGTTPDAKQADPAMPMVGYQKAKEQVQLLKAERAELGRDLQDKHPKMRKLADEISRQEKLLEIFRQQNRDQLENLRQTTRLQIQNLEESIRHADAQAQESGRKMFDYEKLVRNEQTLQARYDQLLKMIQGVGLTKNIDQENVSIMENASAAGRAPSDLVKQLILGLLAGLAGGAGILYMLDRHDDRISSVTEMMQVFDQPVFGHVPALDIGRKKLELVHLHDQRHSFVEAFRDIRSALFFTAVKGNRPKTILVSSSIPNEGKSSISANLAVTLAVSGSRVLVIDSDLRCGTLHKLFDQPAEPGLSEILNRKVHYSEVIKPTATPNLSFIPCGKPVANAGELFLSQDTENFFKEIYPQYDYIVIDSAPILATADTASLAPKMDGVLFLLRGAFTSARLARNALDVLQQRQVNVLGLILNRVDTAYPEYYQYKYSKYYRAAVPA